ncbi:hypothetical protein CI109_103773 [Kwoniella shandongensis]|uniref:Uncharacterized protein n=1 Tax=Kwoniella shandongensis TaxID=1734106 RepID=A0A5M6C761_9TREE|nr:uncharacterized protein CI109_000530 [Kwoniella shandongensis]KAA5530958.1 hypothetical protein CI109_000530 [Kwoniella shandongensis]
MHLPKPSRSSTAPASSSGSTAFSSLKRRGTNEGYTQLSEPDGTPRAYEMMPMSESECATQEPETHKNFLQEKKRLETERCYVPNPDSGDEFVEVSEIKTEQDLQLSLDLMVGTNLEELKRHARRRYQSTHPKTKRSSGR